MSAAFLGLLEALVLLALATVLFALSLKRRYPVRSMMVYGSLHGLAVVSLIGAYGGWAVSEGISPTYFETLAFIAGVARAMTIVIMGALVMYEVRYKPSPCLYRQSKEP
jgi:hypothetical protein